MCITMLHFFISGVLDDERIIIVFFIPFISIKQQEKRESIKGSFCCLTDK